MIKSKKYNIIAGSAILVAVLIVLFLLYAPMQFGSSLPVDLLTEQPEYVDALFDGSVLSIDILADETEWQGMLDDAASEAYIMVDVVVNGTTFQNVGLRPKGNSSLTQVLNSDSDRYSFRLQFDEYITDQTCFGLDGFVVNNMISDPSYMKEYVSYEMMQVLGVDAPCMGFADIKLNGETWGFYLAVETYGESYEERTFGDSSGMLYNVKSMDMGGGGQGGGGEVPTMPEGRQGGVRPGDPTQETKPTTDASETQAATETAPSDTAPSDAAATDTPETAPATDTLSADQAAPPTGEMGGRMGGGMGGGMGGSTGGSLEYSDDSSDSYSAIFGNVVGKGTESDYQRVIRALKALSEGEDLETYFDVDQILRYLAAHTFVVNLDSYSSNMAQNYYIYEKDGQVTILPWDYNLAWGGFQSGGASSVVNFPIDTPVSGVEMEARPLLAKLFENSEYLTRYHGYLQELVDQYFANGQFAERIDALDARIGEYVKNDPSAFSTYEEYQTAVASFKTLGELRAQSVQGQLAGTVPSTTEGQSAEPDQLIDPGDLTISGSGMGGHGGGGMEKNIPTQRTDAPNAAATETGASTEAATTQAKPEEAGMSQVPQEEGNAQQGMRRGNMPPGATQETSETSQTVLLLTGSGLLLLFLIAILAKRHKRNY